MARSHGSRGTHRTADRREQHDQRDRRERHDRKHPIRRSRAAPVAAALLAAVSTPKAAEAQPPPLSIDPPAPPGSVSPTLASEKATTADKGYDILMTWREPGEAGGRLKFSRFSNQGWTPPITVAQAISAPRDRDPPSLTVLDTQAVRRTLIARTGNVVARSGDAGRTWTRLPASVLPFSSFAGRDEGGYVFWLGFDEDGSAKLLGTRILAGRTVLDPDVAGNSSTAAAMTWDGPVVVYRDRSSDGTENIAVIRREDARWTRPRPVAIATRKAARRLVGGPRVAASRRRVAVGWLAMKENGARVHVAFSHDAGRTFGAPVEVKHKNYRHFESVDVDINEDGQALVLWTTAVDHRRLTLNLARVAPDGRRGKTRVIAEQLPRRLNGLPRVAGAGTRVAVTWATGNPSRVRVVAIPLSDIPAPSNRSTRVAAQEKTRRVSGRGRVGESIPDLELTSLAGEKVSPGALRGRAVLLNFWATWCRPCIKEMPDLAALHHEYGPKGLVVIGVNVDDVDAHDKVRRFAAEHQLPFTVWLDPETRLSDALRVRRFPSTFVLDREGRIVLRRNRALAAHDPKVTQALRGALQGS